MTPLIWIILRLLQVHDPRLEVAEHFSEVVDELLCADVVLLVLLLIGVEPDAHSFLMLS